MQALAEGDTEKTAAFLKNVFEEVLPEEFGEVFAIKEALLSYGALGAAMTGSGPTVFGVFKTRETAEKAYTALKERYAETYLAEPV